MEKPSFNSRPELLEKAKELPGTPGVYLMRDISDEILYVGKAKSLRNRVTTYFQPAEHEVPRTQMMVARVGRFEVILTETESEALILEATLIKKHKPKFNVRLKDDKAYPYIRIQMNESFPRLEWSRKVLRDGALYFGPFPSAWSARQVLRLLTETFRLRDCSDNTFRHRSRPCILYQMAQCTGPCVGKVTAIEYQDQIREAVAVLQGKGDSLVEGLEKEMNEASADEDFERAAEIRDQVQSLRIVTETQTAIEAGVERDRDVVGVARKGAEAHGALLQIRGGKLLSVRHFHLQNTDSGVEDHEIVTQFLAQHYLEEEKRGDQKLASHPKEVLVPVAPDDPGLLERTLSVGVRLPESDIDRQLLNVARVNAQHSLDLAERRAHGHGLQALEEIQKKLHLTKLPQRIECYDISNIQGEDPVASRVVFIDGAPEKTLYRRYKIRTVEGSNDFAMMKEVLSRRFSKQDLKDADGLPDLVVVDGGKGQLSQAVAIMDELDLQGVEVVGLAKARTESDFQSTEVKSSMERIFIPGRKNPVPLLPHTEAYKLLVHVRDEAHRFAISYHRLLRDKRSLGEGNS